MTIAAVFSACSAALTAGTPLERLAGAKGDHDGEGWLAERLAECNLGYLRKGRQFPDFKLVSAPLGIEVKSAAYPDRRDFDANSHLPSGSDKERQIYYLFLRYAKAERGPSPLTDLVLCHGSLLNIGGCYPHLNESVPGFGAYGDAWMRMRNMYRLLTPYELACGLDRQATLLAPAAAIFPGLTAAGALSRTETAELIKTVSVDYESGERAMTMRANPNAGRVHRFCAWRSGDAGDPVRLRETADNRG